MPILGVSSSAGQQRAGFPPRSGVTLQQKLKAQTDDVVKERCRGGGHFNKK